jgi:hypothetical protein
VLVSPISISITETDIQELFGVFGKISKISIYRDDKKKPDDYSIIEYKDIKSVDNALLLSGSRLDNNVISVEYIEENESFSPYYIKVEGLSDNVHYSDIIDLFGVMGDIEFCKIWFHSYAYIKYFHEEDGKFSLQFNKSKIQGNEITVSHIDESNVDENKFFMNELDPNDVKNGNLKLLIQLKGIYTFEKIKLKRYKNKNNIN